MDGGGAASPDADTCDSPRAGPIVAMDGGGAAASPLAAIWPGAGAGPIAAFTPAVRVESWHVFKNRLHVYAMKVGIPAPEYQTLKEGPPHRPVFKSTVFVNNTRYESLPGFFNRKAAEQSAAEVALMEIAMSAPLTETRIIRAVQETGLCKNLLQEYAQKMNYAIPSYVCTKQASDFICRVEIGGKLYIGAAARRKKEAEVKAARTALLAIQGQSEGGANGVKNYIVVPGQRPVKETDKKPVETVKLFNVYINRGFRRKWNKRKFMKMEYDYEEYELPGDTAMVQFNKEVTMMQPGEGDMMAQLEPPRDPVEVQHNKEASVEQDLPSNDEVVKPKNEAITIELESVSAYVASQSTGDSADAKEEPSNASMM